MRIRNRTLDGVPVDTGPFLVRHYNPPLVLLDTTPAFSPGGSVKLVSGNEYIEDSQLIPRGEFVNDVTHYSSILSRKDISSFDETANGSDRYTYNGPNAHWYSWGTYGEITHAMLSASYGSTQEALVRKAMHAFLNENKVDNLLNIIEGPTLLPSLRNVGKLLAKRKFVSALASGHLGYSFGIAPLAADMIKMTAAMPSIKAGFNAVVRDCDRELTVRARSAGKLLLTPSGLGVKLPGNDGWWEPIGVSQLSPPTSIVTLVGHRDRPQYANSTLQKIDAFMRKYLSGGPASFLWEHLPYSFVVDWFVDTSGIVDSLNETLTGLSSRIKRLSYSQKYMVDIDIKKMPTSVWTSDSDYTITVHNTLKYYHRESIRPDLVGTNSRFGKRQAALSASLLHNIVAKLKSRR